VATTQVERNVTEDGYQPVPCKVVLDTAAEANLRDVIVIGTEQDGTIFVGGSESDLGLAMLLMERAKRHLLNLLEADVADQKK
jgi:hypothetical protein